MFMAGWTFLRFFLKHQSKDFYCGMEPRKQNSTSLFQAYLSKRALLPVPRHHVKSTVGKNRVANVAGKTAVVSVTMNTSRGDGFLPVFPNSGYLCLSRNFHHSAWTAQGNFRPGMHSPTLRRFPGAAADRALEETVRSAARCSLVAFILDEGPVVPFRGPRLAQFEFHRKPPAVRARSACASIACSQYLMLNS